MFQLLFIIVMFQIGHAFVPQHYHHHHHHSTTKAQHHAFLHKRQQRITQQQMTKEEEDEWRAFRAKLVQNGLPTTTDDADDDTADKVQSNPSTTTAALKQSKKNNSRYAYNSTPLVEVGTILLSIPTTDLCQALEQHYWHRSVVLVTKVAGDTKHGDAETVPEEQLAQGSNRGRWSYRGLLLNRFTDLEFDYATGEEDGVNDDDDDDCPFLEKGDSWKIQRGGDLLGLDSGEDGSTEFTCLYHGSSSSSSSADDSHLKSVATKLVGDLYMLSLNDAQHLCKHYSSKYKPTDFLTFGGFCSWRPSQLEYEMGEERGEWMALSVDDVSIWEELQLLYNNAQSMKQLPNVQTSHGLLESGTTMWRIFLSMVNVTEEKATTRLPSKQLDFYDLMLTVWAEENLSTGTNDDDDDDDDTTFYLQDSSKRIQPGTLLRGSGYVSNDSLLFDCEFIKSTVLVLEETEEVSVGILLNHPMGAGVECLEEKDPLPLRYGGPIEVPEWRHGSSFEDGDDDDDEDDNDEMYEGFLDYQSDASSDSIMYAEVELDLDDDYDDDEDEDSPFIWLHRDAALGSRGPSKGGGTQLGSSDIWIIPENDAISALKSGFLCQEDTMVFSGVCIWEKGDDLGQVGGGLREQVDVMKSFEIVNPMDDDHDVMELVWDILSEKQDVLVKETFDDNIKATMEAWSVCMMDKVTSQAAVENDGKLIAREGLSDAALRAWLGANLLGDPLGTYVEVRNDQRQELSEQ